MKEQNSFLTGIKDGIPICLGYLSVSFAFGIFSVENGLSILEDDPHHAAGYMTLYVFATTNE